MCNKKSKISVNLGNKKKLAFAVTMALGLSSAYANEDVNKEISSNDDIEHMTILGKITSGEYRNDFASSATKTYTNNLDIAQPVDVVNQALIDSQLALQLDDVYRNSASVNIVDPLGHTNIRGFRLNENSGGILKNGLREVSQGFAFPSLANIEKIEILKGSSSALYGRGEPGGIVNLITNQDEFTQLSDSVIIRDIKEIIKNGGPKISLIAPIDGFVTQALDAQNNHHGIDLVSEKGDQIIAPQDGIVVFSGINFARITKTLFNVPLIIKVFPFITASKPCCATVLEFIHSQFGALLGTSCISDLVNPGQTAEQ